MSSPFGCNQKNLFGSKAKPKDKPGPEPVTLVANKNQVITAIIPFNTKQAANIRQHMHANVTHDGQRIFLYRAQNGWTNISLESTESAPKLTCDPTQTLIIAWKAFNECPLVNPLQIKWEGSDQVLGYDDIATMETQFEALPDATEDTVQAGSSKTDAEVLYDMITDTNKTIGLLQDKLEGFDAKLAHIVDLVEKNATSVEPGETPTRTTSSTKRKAPAK